MTNNNFSVLSTSCEIIAVRGDGNRPYLYLVLDDRACQRQRRCVQERDGTVHEDGDGFAVGG